MSLVVRTYVKDSRSGERVFVDFEEDDRSERFIALTSEGGWIHLGIERVYLNWSDLVELAELIQTGAKTLRPKR